MTDNSIPAGGRRPAPPADLVAAAQAEYHRGRAKLDELLVKVREQLAAGVTDFEAVADVWMSLRLQQDKPEALVLAAISVVHLAKAPPQPRLGEPGRQQ